MANPAQVPMIAPDGTPGMVDPEKQQSLANQGYKPGLILHAPDGTRGVAGFDKLPSLLSQGYKTTGMYQQQTTANPDQPHGLIQSLVAPIPLAAKGLYHNVMDAPRDPNEQAIKGTSPDSGIMARALGQIGLGGYRTILAPSIANAKAAVQDAQSPNLSNRLASGSEALAAIPILGQGIDAGKSVISQYLSGDKSGAVGSAIGNVGTAGLTDGMTQGLFPKPVAGTLSPLERASVAVTKAVNPQGIAFRGYRQAIADQGVNVLDYAKKNNLPITDARDFGKAASLAAQETQNHYTGNVLGPHVDTPVSLTGVATELGDSASLGDINQRVNNITQDLRAGQRKATPGQTASALSGDDIRSMQAEQGGLTDILHRSLGDLNQMDPTDIANLRQRAGQMRTIAGETEGGADSLSGTTGKSEVGAGPGLPTSSHGVVDALIKKLQGGPEAIASRNVVKALRGLQDIADAPRGGLPEAYPQTGITKTPNGYYGNQPPLSAADQINLTAQQRLAQQAYQHGADLDTAAHNASQGRSGIADYLRNSNADIQKQAANLEFLQSAKLEQAAQDAASLRNAAAENFRTKNANKGLQSEMDARNRSRSVGDALRKLSYDNGRKR